MRQQIIPGIAGGLILMIISTGIGMMSDGRLIALLGGATASSLANATNLLSTEITQTDARFSKLELMLTQGDADCDQSRREPQPPRCPEGWIDNDLVFGNSYPGGRCRQGTIHRLCIRAGN